MPWDAYVVYRAGSNSKEFDSRSYSDRLGSIRVNDCIFSIPKSNAIVYKIDDIVHSNSRKVSIYIDPHRTRR